MYKGGFNEDGTAKKDANGSFVVRPDPIATLFRVGLKAFRNRIEGTIKHEKRGRMPLFSEDEEQFLLDLIKLRALIGRPIGQLELTKSARKLSIAKINKPESEPLYQAYPGQSY